MMIALVVAASACLQGPPELAPIFSVDEIRYWWEGEFLLVNITFTNRANFTPGVDSPTPWLRLEVSEWARTSEKSRYYPGVVYRGVNSDRFTLTYGFGEDPWQKRWYSDRARAAAGASYAYPNYGPVQFPPNASSSPEIVYKPWHSFGGQDGFYSLQAEILAKYPHDIAQGRVGGSTEYYTGCFNKDTPEFYGFEKVTGNTCHHWDCTGEDVSAYSKSKFAGKPYDYAIPKCDATDARGPYYDTDTWGDN